MSVHRWSTIEKNAEEVPKDRFSKRSKRSHPETLTTQEKQKEKKSQEVSLQESKAKIKNTARQNKHWERDVWRHAKGGWVGRQHKTIGEPRAMKKERIIVIDQEQKRKGGNSTERKSSRRARTLYKNKRDKQKK